MNNIFKLIHESKFIFITFFVFSFFAFCLYKDHEHQLIVNQKNQDSYYRCERACSPYAVAEYINRCYCDKTKEIPK